MYDLYSIDINSRGTSAVMTKIASGTRAAMGKLMDYRRHNPNTQAERSLKWAIYHRDNLVSSTVSGGGLNAGR